MSDYTGATAETGHARVRRWVVACLASIVLGSMTATFALSFAAIVYAGPLAPFLGPGIALTLIGAIVMALVAPLNLTYRGTLVQPQDVTAILLALGAASIAARPGLSPDSAFSTVVVLVGSTSVIAGIAAYATGALRLGYLARFVPFPVINGFLAASGALLILGGFDMVMPVSQDGARQWISGLVDNWMLWAPWLLLGLAIVLATRRTGSGAVIPLALIVGLATFYTATASAGLDHAAIRALGLLIGPFEGSSFLSDLRPNRFGGVDWVALLDQLPIVLTVVGLTVLGTLLNASGLEIAIDSEVDLERDLKGVGIANIAAGTTGGLVGYHTLGETLLARRLGIVGAVTGVGVAVVTALILLFGAEVLTLMPIGLFAAVIWYLGFDLFLTAVFDHGRKMPPADFAIVVITPLIALFFGFMPAVAFGVAMAALVFVITYSSIDLARLATTGANFHARVERSPADQARLAEIGNCVQIHRLDGYVFFGSASRLVGRLQRHFTQTPKPRFAVVDFKRVVGMDISAWAAFARLARSCRQQGIELILTGMSKPLGTRFEQFEQEVKTARGRDLDDVLVEIEERLLKEDRLGSLSPAVAPDQDFVLDDNLASLLRKYGFWMKLTAGDALMAQGARSDHLIFLVEGRCRATIEDRYGGHRVVSRFLPGAMLGEIAYYAGVPRTASITVETEATAVRIDAEGLAKMEREDAAGAAAFHRMLAVVLARRLMTTTRLLNDAEL